MTSGPLSKKQIYAEALQGQRAKVESFLEVLRGGQIPQVASLEMDISVLCENISHLKPEDAREVEQDLRSLLLLVEEFARELEDIQADLKTKMADK